jgi:hypothetical protein
MLIALPDWEEEGQIFGHPNILWHVGKASILRDDWEVWTDMKVVRGWGFLGRSRI